MQVQIGSNAHIDGRIRLNSVSRGDRNQEYKQNSKCQTPNDHD
jgi:hypothetical protein